MTQSDPARVMPPSGGIGQDRPPARIDRAMIARAAYQIGLDRVTMKGVADRLGVSVPGLYHHVRGRDDLMRLGAEYSAAELHVPVDRDQHWAAWLLEWARYSHDAFVAQPALLGQFLSGSLGVDRMVTHVNAVIGVLFRHGFSPIEAVDAYDSSAIVPSAPRSARFAKPKRPERVARSQRVPPCPCHRTAGCAPAPARAGGGQTDAPTDFTGRIITVLAGIALRRGEPWEPTSRGRISRAAPMTSWPCTPRWSGLPVRSPRVSLHRSSAAALDGALIRAQVARTSGSFRTTSGGPSQSIRPASRQ